MTALLKTVSQELKYKDNENSPFAGPQFESAGNFYVTNYNFKKAFQNARVNISVSDEDLETLYTSDLSMILSKGELVYLCRYKKLLEDNLLVIREVKKVAQQESNSKDLIKYAPRYHKYSDCVYMFQDMTQLRLPEVDISQELHKKMSAFKDKYSYLIDSDLQKFETLFAEAFPNTGGLVEKTYANSGRMSVQNYKLERMVSMIEELLKNAEAFKSTSQQHTDWINLFGNKTHSILEAKQPNHILYKWHNSYKTELKKLLLSYLSLRLNPNMKFQGTLLQELGITPCKACAAKTKARSALDKNKE